MIRLRHYVFPRRCAVCGRVISHNADFCFECEGLLEPINKKFCTRCGNLKSKCKCKSFVYHFRGSVSPFLNEGAAQSAVYGFKLSKNRDAAETLARYIADCVSERFPDIDFDCVTAVPMHRDRAAESGFNHSVILAREVAKCLGLPYRNLLKKHKKTQSQHTLAARERFPNAKGAYKAAKNNYRYILLIDDIKTTGATLDECARMLMKAGADNVYCATAVLSVK